MDELEVPPEAVLLRLARKAAGISLPAAATAANLSKARLSQIENGYETKAGARRVVRGKDSTIARLAAVYRLRPERLESAGRADAAEVLREIRRVEEEADDALRPADDYEREVAATPGLSDETIAQLFRAHRAKPPDTTAHGDDEGEEEERRRA